MANTGSVTALLVAWGRGEERALERLVPLVDRELHRIARRFAARERAGHTLQATALVNEAYVRLIEGHRVAWQDRAHFLAVSARVMRRILVDSARARHARKRGGDAVRVTFDENLPIVAADRQEVIALDDALRKLEAFDSRKSQVIELRFFGGLTVEETAAVLKVSTETVKRDWKLARAWLLKALRGGS
jgi:RNA polymerase sigma factor (TIGR02999 family)